ncbi:MAG TPA: hypothetical protein VF053_21205 [Streptosporangiales bacterium]
MTRQRTTRPEGGQVSDLLCVALVVAFFTLTALIAKGVGRL